MRYLPIILLLIIVNISACEDENTCGEGNRVKACIIDKVIFPRTGFGVDFIYDNENRIISLLRSDGKNGFNVEYSKSDEVKKVTLFTEDGYDRVYTYKHFAFRTDIIIDDPSDQFFTKEYVRLRKNLCGQITNYQFYRDEWKNLTREIIYEWADGNIKSHRHSPDRGGCLSGNYSYDNNPNPFYFLSEILLNPFLGSTNNRTRTEGGCSQPYDDEIQYQSNGNPKSFQSFMLSIFFAVGVDANVVYQECP